MNYFYLRKWWSIANKAAFNLYRLKKTNLQALKLYRFFFKFIHFYQSWA